jgi:hypothetical protein
LAVFPPASHPAGFAKSNPSPEHNQQYPHGFGCCGAGKIAAGCTGCADWVLFLHFRLIFSPSFSCLLIYIFFFHLHNHNPKSELINNEKERERFRDLLDPIHERGLERERKKTWIMVMEKRQIFVSMIFVLLLWLVGANEEEEAERGQ